MHHHLLSPTPHPLCAPLDQVRLSLPPKTERVVPCPLSAPQIKLYRLLQVRRCFQAEADHMDSDSVHRRFKLGPLLPS